MASFDVFILGLVESFFDGIVEGLLKDIFLGLFDWFPPWLGRRLLWWILDGSFVGMLLGLVGVYARHSRGFL
jgi:hypothetical protein